jgi:transposase
MEPGRSPAVAARVSKAKLARDYLRIEIVLWIAEGQPVREAAQRGRADRTSAYRCQQRYLACHDPACLSDRPRSGRPTLAPQLTPELLGHLLAQDPRELGHQATSWTVPLLAQHLRQQHNIALSERTLRERLHEFGYSSKILTTGTPSLDSGRRT